MLRSLLNGALRSGALSGRRGSTRGGMSTGRSGYAGRRGRQDLGGAVGGQVGRSLLNGLLRRR